jgi:hypothetical protein
MTPHQNRHLQFATLSHSDILVAYEITLLFLKGSGDGELHSGMSFCLLHNIYKKKNILVRLSLSNRTKWVMCLSSFHLKTETDSASETPCSFRIFGDEQIPETQQFQLHM